MQLGPGWRRGRINIRSLHRKMKWISCFSKMDTWAFKRGYWSDGHVMDMWTVCRHFFAVVWWILPALMVSIHWKWQLGWAVKISLGLLSRIHCGTCISLIAYEVWHITKSSLTSERITITVLSISIPAGVFDQSDWWKDYKRPSYLDRRLEVSSSTSIRPPSLSPERAVFQRTLSSS